MRCAIFVFLVEILFVAIGGAISDGVSDVADIQMALRENAALRARITHLLVALEQCSLEVTNLRKAARARGLQSDAVTTVRPHAANDTESDKSLSTQPSQVFWLVTEGDCVLDSEGCITSPNYPAAYNDADFCTIAIEPTWTGTVDVRDF